LELPGLVLGFTELVSTQEDSVKPFTGLFSRFKGGDVLICCSAPGNVLDWAYAVARIKYSYAAHLRDTGTYGFLLPEEWIRPTGEETTALINYLATFILKDPKVSTLRPLALLFDADSV